MKSVQNPRILNPLTGATQTATGTFAFQLPVADSYNCILDTGAVAGTTPTMDVALQHSPDNGAHWYTFAKFAQVTATGQRSLVFTPQVSLTQAATEQALANTGAAVSVNQPIVYSKVQVLVTVGGTAGPSFANVYLFIVCSPAAGSTLV